MKIGIGLPNPVRGVPGRRLVEWAQRAEERGFAGLATIDRLAYPSHDSLTTLAAAAGATTRIGLITNILIAPLYPPPLLAKVAASVDQLSGGRLSLGLAPGGRPDDYALVGRDFRTRGRDFDAALELIHRAWAGEVVEGSAGQPVSPPPVREGRVPILFGGTGAAALARMARWGAGLTIGGAGAAQAAAIVDQVRSAWKDAGRDGEPRIAALAYYSLGADAEEESRAYLRDYYGFLGGYAEQIAAGALRSAQAIRAEVAGFEAAGVTELYLDPTAVSLDQVDRLAEVVL
jgi:alkanesulfonate monooxygenase SsuD/methylene tetrahydromethanopterin reductase-like flavin-dependent oxidoreductase (luciferase family)